MVIFILGSTEVHLKVDDATQPTIADAPAASRKRRAGSYFQRFMTSGEADIVMWLKIM